jgi:hypothetical protein
MNLYAITTTIDYETYHSLERMFTNEDDAITDLNEMIANLEADGWATYNTLYLEMQDETGFYTLREYEINRETNTYTRTR